MKPQPTAPVASVAGHLEYWQPRGDLAEQEPARADARVRLARGDPLHAVANLGCAQKHNSAEVSAQVVAYSRYR